MRRISLTGEALRYNLRKDRWLLRMTTLGKCWCGISLISAASFLNAFSDAKILRNRCAESLHLLPRKLVAIFSGGGAGGARAEKSVCTPQVTGMDGEYRKRFAAIGKTLSKRMFNEKLTLN